MVRKKKLNHNFFNIPQIGKRFFYRETNTGLVDSNTVINYECNVTLLKPHLEELIKGMTGEQSLPGPQGKYGYHIDKNKNKLGKQFLTKLNVPDEIKGYTLTSVAVAASHNGLKANGNILIIFTKQRDEFIDEVAISLHINMDDSTKNYDLKLRELAKMIAKGVQALRDTNIYDLSSNANFDQLGYTITSPKETTKHYRQSLQI